ncbi:DUF3344 domain-containing protein [Streptomyces tsukubensis]|uniref:DUF3344 domain-containing protein n=1 Tax=Streptomyces tsukubensis TaxID=83656 RepID=A0A1V4A476_9ACTN|nr:DUF3344 domain-containing protein [Streptomyces tsukubensis]OON75374.1 DUF3344 domain-containing protein [Streptomyces tsukubensis]QFR94996.1 DUF3344 domain-containing protein [Streptomyces tsukubensis]
MRSRIPGSAAVRRALVCVLALLALAPAMPAAGTPGPRSPRVGALAQGAGEAERIPFTSRWSGVQHGGVVRAANSALTCRRPVSKKAPACAGVRAGRAVGNDDYDLFYADVDNDPNTYNSSRAELRIPPGSQVSYARLYWGGNLRVGEQKPARDNGRVLLAEPGGSYRQVVADTAVGHRDSGDADAYQASADVTDMVRTSGAGSYTVAQINVAMGHSRTGGWGGWTLVAAYEKASEPLRRIALLDGFETLRADSFDQRDLRIRLRDFAVPAGARGRAGFVSYDGDTGTDGDSVAVSTGRSEGVPLGNAVNPANDVFNSTIGEPNRGAKLKRTPSQVNTFGYDSDVFDLRNALRRGGRHLDVEFSSQRDSAWLGALFIEADAQTKRGN